MFISVGSSGLLIDTTLSIFIVSGTTSDLLIITKRGAEIRGDKIFKTFVGTVLSDPALFCRELIIVYTRSEVVGLMKNDSAKSPFKK